MVYFPSAAFLERMNDMIKNNKSPWFLLLPSILIMGIFVFYPIVKTFYYSLHRFKLTRPDQIEMIGLRNYMSVLQDKNFHNALINSLSVLAYVILFVMISSLFVALLLNQKRKLTPLLTAIAILPWALPPLVNGVLWSFIFHPSYGMLNKLLISSGITQAPIAWTANTGWLMLIVSLIVSWQVVPFCAIVLLANLQSIPQDIYEASAMDGANSPQTFFSVTLPLLLPSLLICLTQASLSAVNIFDEIVALVDYRKDAQTLLIYNYQNTFSFLDFGYGSAITYVVMLLTGIFGYLYVRNIAKDM
ncbi:carbohydrate ABC transporter permease [Facklamia hominis]|uniref:Sugar ABC transporter permease n=1 Tax=Facklamia hominis TaxID=178214 RepID=A0AAJ1V1R5_9LACT|nr:sugar ABC transporter permease [Facklamia hominis]MDK7186815.1 sugar ABC transporter permease [Facklamia hominis]